MTPNFDRVARLYRWAEYLTLGPLLQRTRTHFLPQLAHSKSAFVLGDGDGRFLSALLTQNPDLQATAVDTSERMLTLLRTRCNTARLQTVHADALTCTPPQDTDLIVTHFFLDCFTQQEINALALGVATKPGILWLVSDFRIPEGSLRPIARAYIRSLYFAFRILTGLRITQLPDPATALTAAGFQRIAQHQTLGGILYTELWQCNDPGAPCPDFRTWVSTTSNGLQSIDRLKSENMSTPTPDNPATQVEDPLPAPEPAAPSLAEPDPGVFHHDPASQETEDTL